MIRRWVLSLHKTVRKYFGEAIVVTQEIEDIISSPIVKESIINNSDCKILLDQRKYLNKFDSIQNLLGLTDKERSQVLSINLANHPSREIQGSLDRLRRYTIRRICHRSKFGRIFYIHNGRNGKDGTFRFV